MFAWLGVMALVIPGDGETGLSLRPKTDFCSIAGCCMAPEAAHTGILPLSGMPMREFERLHLGWRMADETIFASLCAKVFGWIGRDRSGATFRGEEVEPSNDCQDDSNKHQITRSHRGYRGEQSSRHSRGESSDVKSSKDDNSNHMKHAHQSLTYTSACTIAQAMTGAVMVKTFSRGSQCIERC